LMELEPRLEVLPADEVRPLLRLLVDPEPSVRETAFEAVTRLPLAPAAWTDVHKYVKHVLEGDIPSAERTAVLQAAESLPRWLYRQIEGTPQSAAADQGLSGDFDETDESPFGDASPLFPPWADGLQLGFTSYAASDVSRIDAAITKLNNLPLDEDGDPAQLFDAVRDPEFGEPLSRESYIGCSPDSRRGRLRVMGSTPTIRGRDRAKAQQSGVATRPTNPTGPSCRGRAWRSDVHDTSASSGSPRENGNSDWPNER